MKLLLYLSVLSLLAGCKVPEKYRRFAEQTPHAIAEFQRLPIEEQLDVYLYLSTESHPPQLDYADLIAIRGKAAVGPIMRVLGKAERDVEKERLIYVLARIAEGGYYNYRDSGAVLQQVERIIASMREDHSIKMSRDSLAAMRRAAARSRRAAARERLGREPCCGVECHDQPLLRRARRVCRRAALCGVLDLRRDRAQAA